MTRKLFNSYSKVNNKVLLEHSYSYSLACTYVYFYVVTYKKKIIADPLLGDKIKTQYLLARVNPWYVYAPN